MATISGAREIQRALAQLPTRLARKVVRQALRAGAKVVQADARANAPVETGRLKKAVKVRSSRSRKKGVISLGVIIGKGNFAGEEFYGAFENFGWKTGKRGSRDRRQIAGRHFMEKALRDKEAEAKSVIESRIAEGVEREGGTK